MNPTQLGPYIIGRKLGAGGMGDVFASIHKDTKAPAAIKVLPSHLGQQLGFRARFEVEVETLRRLDHPNIVSILGFGEQEGTLFYAMELVEGKSLDDAAQQGKRLPWRQVVEIALQLCKALKHAHDRGIIHRDIKPANIMLLADGQVKLADFGIAQLYGVTGLTIDGGVVGTASYLSPEQADGQKTSPRSDLYSLGATLYALLTGRPPFVGKTLPELLRLQRTATPSPPSLLAPDIPCELDAVILGLLAKAPSERIGAPMMLAKSLTAVQDAADLRTPPPVVERDTKGKPAASSVDATQAAGVDATLASPSDSIAPAKPPKPGTPPPVGPSANPNELTMASQGSAQQQPPTAPPGASVHEDLTLASLPAAGVKASESPASRAAPGTPTKPSVPNAVNPEVTEVSQHASLDLTPASASSQKADELTPATVFLTSEQAAEMDRQRQQEQLVVQPREIPVGMIALTVFVIALSVLIYLVLRPPSADTLMGRINKAAISGDSQQLMDVSGDIDEFRNLYPDDPRLAKLVPLEQRLSQLRTQRLRPIVQKHFDTGQQNLPVSQLRDQALMLAAANPQQAVAQLDAILTLYGDPSVYDAQEQEILADIQVRRDQLAVSGNQSAAGHVMLIRQRLDHARELLTKEPAQAKAIAQAIVDLYADKPWASLLVEQARLLAAEPGK